MRQERSANLSQSTNRFCSYLNKNSVGSIPLSQCAHVCLSVCLQEKENQGELPLKYRISIAAPWAPGDINRLCADSRSRAKGSRRLAREFERFSHADEVPVESCNARNRCDLSRGKGKPLPCALASPKPAKREIRIGGPHRRDARRYIGIRRGQWPSLIIYPLYDKHTVLQSSCLSFSEPVAIEREGAVQLLNRATDNSCWSDAPLLSRRLSRSKTRIYSQPTET